MSFEQVMKHILLTTIAAVLLVGVGLRDSKKFKWTLAFLKKLTVKEKGIPQYEMPQTI